MYIGDTVYAFAFFCHIFYYCFHNIRSCVCKNTAVNIDQTPRQLASQDQAVRAKYEIRSLWLQYCTL